MRSQPGDEGLSEVIGFILIVAVITIVASLYLTYVVPSQGREMEIAQMDSVRDQFTDFKISADSLIINNETGITLSKSINLGTRSGATQGSFLNLPLMQPVPSGGTLVINGRDDRISLFVEGYRNDALPNQGSRSPSGTVAPINSSSPPTAIQAAVTGIPPRHIYLVLSVNHTSGSDISPTLPSRPSSVVQVSDSANPSWKFEIGAVPVTDITNSSASGYSYVYTTDLRVVALSTAVIGNQARTLTQEFTARRGIGDGVEYSLDLMDFVDDLSTVRESLRYPLTLNVLTVNVPGGPTITARYQVEYPYAASNGPVLPQMGSIEYRSANRYWIQQDYFYQEGGVFLRQDDGMAPRILPLISATRQGDLLLARMNHVAIEGAGSTASGGPVQVQTRLVSNEQVSGGYPNAHKVTIAVTGSGENSLVTAAMWGETFRRICAQANSTAGVPYQPGAPLSGDNWMSVGVEGNIASLVLAGPYSDPAIYDVELDLSIVRLAIDAQAPSGGTNGGSISLPAVNLQGVSR
ncbi:MAG: hypothetical protein LUQ25_00615 [Methanoregulaceae archaeon]|nr:hypothetical protein [Methanoregulaceae archaeon]